MKLIDQLRATERAATPGPWTGEAELRSCLPAILAELRAGREVIAAAYLMAAARLTTEKVPSLVDEQFRSALRAYDAAVGEVRP